MIPVLTVPRAVAAVRSGGLVVVPTETVYGLAANALDQTAVAKIFRAKGRPQINPIICHLPSADAVFRYGMYSRTADALSRFWPRPLTVLLAHENRIPSIVTAGSPYAGFRVPDHPVMLEFLRACEVPIAAPSANRSGRRSPTTLAMVRADADDAYSELVAGALDGGPCRVGLESTVVAVVSEDPPTIRILRPGGVTRETLIDAGLQVIGDANNPAQENNRSTTEAPLLHAPGQLLKHYGPGVPLLLMERATSGSEKFTVQIRAALARFNAGGAPVWWLGFAGRPAPVPCDFVLDLSVRGDLAEAAQNLFVFFERIRNSGPAVILAETLPQQELGVALNDRLTRAAAEWIPFV